MKNYFTLMLVVVGSFCSHQNLIAQNCSDNIIYVDTKLITDSGTTVPIWISKQPSNSICATTPLLTIDLEKIPELDIPAWLRDNSDVIDFEHSFPLIEKTHLLDSSNPDHAKYIQDADYQIIVEKNFYGITFKDLKIGLNEVIYTKMPQSEYYKNYKRAVDENIFHGVKLKSTNGFIFDKHNFSAPLLLSIISKLGIKYGQVEDEVEQDKCYFQFTFINNDEEAVMKVSYKDKVMYYDFSDEPGRAKSKTMNKTKKEIIKNSL